MVSSKWSFATNVELLRREFHVFPRTSLVVLAAYLVVGFMGTLFEGDFPARNTIGVLAYIAGALAILFGLTGLKLIMMLALYRARTGEHYPGSLFLSSAIASSFLFLAMPMAFYVMSEMRGEGFSIVAMIVLTTVGYPLTTSMIWLYCLMQQHTTWPSIFPRQ
jgi:hypothetical protein